MFVCLFFLNQGLTSSGWLGIPYVAEDDHELFLFLPHVCVWGCVHMEEEEKSDPSEVTEHRRPRVFVVYSMNVGI